MQFVQAIFKHRDPIQVTIKFLELYFTINDIKKKPGDLAILAYYCLYGISKETDLKIWEGHLSHQDRENAFHTIYNARTRMKYVYKIITYDENRRVYHLHENLKKTFTKLDKLGLGFIIKLEHEV